MFSSFIRRVFNLPYRLNIRYDTAGRGAPIVLIHGIAANGSVWDGMLGEIDKTNRVIVLDLLGFGDSPKPEYIKYSAKDHARSVRYTLNRMHIKNYVLVGHSMGALIALKLASKYPKNVKSLVCVAMPSYDMSSGRKKALIRYKTKTYVRLYNAMINHPDLTWATTQALIKSFGSKIGLSLERPSIVPFQKSLSNTILRQDSLNELAKVKVPTSVIFGSLDPFIVQDYFSPKYIENSMVQFAKLRTAHALDDVLFGSIKTEIQQLDSN